MNERNYKCPNCGTFVYGHRSISEDSLKYCPKCDSAVGRDFQSDVKDGLYYQLDPFMEELIRPEWKAKGRRWTQEHKIKGLDN